MRPISFSIRNNYILSLDLYFLFAEGVLISISCKAWAHNIKHDMMERLGLTHFELMID